MELRQEPLFKPYIERNTDFQREVEKEGNQIKKQNLNLKGNGKFKKKVKVKILKSTW